MTPESGLRRPSRTLRQADPEPQDPSQSPSRVRRILPSPQASEVRPQTAALPGLRQHDGVKTFLRRQRRGRLLRGDPCFRISDTEQETVRRLQPPPQWRKELKQRAPLRGFRRVNRAATALKRPAPPSQIPHVRLGRVRLRGCHSHHARRGSGNRALRTHWSPP